MEESKMDYKQQTGKIKLFLFKDDDTFNPLSPKSDQYQISPCNINAL